MKGDMPKRAALLYQHLERISRSALEKHQRIIRRLIRGRHGIYALYHRDKLYYVGLASNLNRRLENHLADRHRQSWDRFSVYLTISDNHMKELESLLLRIVMPAGNYRNGRFLESEDLLPKLEDEIRTCQKRELDAFLGRASTATPKRRSSAAATKGRRPILSAYVTGGMRIKGRYKNRTIRAWVRRDGSISFNGQVFSSPSMAAASACGHTRCNGWQFWTYERAPGDWVRLTELRR